MSVGRPAGALWTLLLVGLLAMLPSAGCAQAVDAGAAPAVAGPSARTGLPAGLVKPDATTVRTTATASPRHGATLGAAADVRLPLTWCSADGEHPLPGNGCSSHPYSGQDSQLPNAPPQPAATVPARLIPLAALPRTAPLTTRAGPALPPDLHALQVHRT